MVSTKKETNALDYAGVTEYNTGVVSDYAKANYGRSRCDETAAEVRLKIALKKR